jgi:hypothetical protein
MLVTFVLPFKIAAVIVLAVGSLVVVVFWRRGNRLREVVGWTATIGLAVMPAIIVGAKSFVDPLRYRIFKCATAAAITDPYVMLPASATNIIYDKQPTGHYAQFTVTKAGLDTWLTTLRAQGLPFDDTASNEGYMLSKEMFQEYFGKYGWKYQADFKELDGPWSERGTGFSVWHSASTNTAVLRAGYW